MPAESETKMDGMEMGGEGLAQAAVMIAPARRQMIGVKTEAVKEQALETTIRTVGSVDYDERRVRQVNLRVSGWITHLHVDYTGQSVERGAPLLALYSPDLVASQEEYLLAKRTVERVAQSHEAHIRAGADAQVTSARNRLLLWKMTEEQIGELDGGQPPLREAVIHSPIGGVVTKKMAVQGMYVTPEMNLYEIADLSAVWLYADVYEYELPSVKVGQEATVTLAAYPGEPFHGRVVYINPYLNTETRSVKVRMEFPNPHGKLKPGMYGDVQIQVTGEQRLAVPREAVLDSGLRTLVFVEQEPGLYQPREVTVGRQVGRFYPVRAGLTAGERVVTSATFLIDSESRLMAATSMMGMLGMGGVRMEQAQMGEMEMGGMPMGEAASSREQTVDGLTIALATDPEPPKKGENRLLLTIRSGGGPVTDAKVTLGYTMAMPGMEVETIAAKQTTDGVYEATADFGMRGAWEVEVTVVRGQGKPLKATFTISPGK